MNTMNETHGIRTHTGTRSSSAKALPPPRTRRLGRVSWVPRAVSVALALCMLWSFVAAPAAAAAVRVKGPQPPRPHSLPQSPAQAARLKAQALHVSAMQRRAQGRLYPYRQANAARALRPLPRRAAPATPLTILSDVGQLAHVVPASLVAAWHRELAARQPAPARAARLHLWLGEYQLAHNQQPETAFAHFQAAQRLARPADPLYGVAAYDRAVAFYSEGAYADAATAFRHLLTRRPRLVGFDPRDAALWLRHARACAGYHADRARAGIPEPDRLDPLCGAAALAASMQKLGSPSSKKTLLAHMHVTGEGSSVGDVVNAARTLDVNARTVRADDEGLILLPKPLVAYVEHDHFVSVVRADKGGVSYLCSDCGPWPGGRVDLTWRQWRLLEGGLYVAVTRPGSAQDRQLAALSPAAALPRLSLGLPALAPVRLAASLPPPGLAQRLLSSLSPMPQLGAILSPPLPALRGHVVLQFGTQGYSCGFRNYSNPCPPGVICCKMISGGPGDPGKGPTSPMSPVGGPGLQPAIAFGPAHGDPVNVATGEEEYAPSPDLTVYNPHGPSVSWGRLYNSLRHNGQGYYEQEAYVRYDGAFDYEMNDFGQGWSTPYNVGVSDPYPGASGASYPKSVFFENGAHIPFVLPAAPTASAPQVQCQPVGAGVPFLIYANYAAAGNTYSVVWSDRTQWVTAPATTISDGVGGSASALGLVYPLGRIVDRNGHALAFHYGPAAGGNFEGQPFQWPLLASVTNDDGTALLTIARVADGSGAVAAVSDCYGRSVLYHVSQYADFSGATSAPGLPGGEVAAGALDHVSQIVATGTASAPDRYVYGYQGGGQIYLHTISVPSPDGTATPSTVTIDYAGDLTVADIQDGNGYKTSFASAVVTGSTDGGTGSPGSGSAPAGTLSVSTDNAYGSNYTRVTVSGNGASYSYVAGYDMNMSGALQTDGAGRVTMSKVFNSTSPDPYRPTSTTDGNGNTAQMTWDQYGNMLSMTPPSGAARTPAATTFTYAYPTNASGNPISTGELQQVQEGAKTPVSYTYYEPSGLMKTLTSPKPGTTGGATVVSTKTYDGFGNVLTDVMPGNNAASTITATYNYTQDGSYGQADAIGQPLTSTDNLGNVTHFRYNARGDRTAVIDAIGIETDFTYNIDDRTLATLYPATGESGSGRSATVSTYLYDLPGDAGGVEQYGPLASVKVYDEGNTTGPLRTVGYQYGSEGETLGASGSTEPVTYAYDGLYRLTTLADGGGHTTHYFYNGQGYLYQVAYPLAGATSSPLAVGARDTITYTGYDPKGDLRTRVDGNGTTTTYTYNDPQSLLTNIHYTLAASPPTYVTSLADTSYNYDAYGRRAAMADANGAMAYAYDDADSLTGATTTYAGLPARTLGYSYYPDGSRQGLTTPAGPFAWGYDGDGRLTSLTNPSGETSSWSYLNNGWLQQRQLSNGATTGDTFDARGQVTDQRTTLGGATLAEFAVPSSGGYDGAGDRLQVGVAGSLATGLTSYAYDGRSQLTQEQSARGGGYTDTQHYDGVTAGTSAGPGNPTTLRGGAQSFNADNQLASAAYDGDGSPYSYGGAGLKFDPEGRLTSDGAAQADGWGGDGLRAWKSAGGVTTYYLYDGTTPIIELNPSGSVTAVNTFGADGLVSRHASAGSVFYDFDLSGNVAQRLTGGGGVASTDLTDGFGAWQTTDTTGDPFAFLGQMGGYRDGETGLTLLTRRFYDPQAGRFLTRDPIGYNGGVNLYAYAGNDPVNASDPEGLQLLDPVVEPAEPVILPDPEPVSPNPQPAPRPLPIYPPVPGPLPQPKPQPPGTPDCNGQMYDCNLIGDHELPDGVHECRYLCESETDTFIWVTTEIGPCENKPADDVPPPRGPAPPETTGPSYPVSGGNGFGYGPIT